MKEFNEVKKAIDKWFKVCEKKGLYVNMYISFLAEHPKTGKWPTDCISMYGPKDNIKIMLEEGLEHIKKEKEDFINI